MCGGDLMGWRQYCSPMLRSERLCKRIRFPRPQDGGLSLGQPWSSRPGGAQAFPGPQIQEAPGHTRCPTACLRCCGTPSPTTLGAPPSRGLRTELNTAPHLQAPAGPAPSHLCHTSSGGSFSCSYFQPVYSEKANTNSFLN